MWLKNHGVVHCSPYSTIFIFFIFLLHLLIIFQLFHLHIVFHPFSLFPISFWTSSSSSNFPPSCNFFQLLYSHVFQSIKAKMKSCNLCSSFCFQQHWCFSSTIDKFPNQFFNKEDFEFHPLYVGWILCHWTWTCS